MQQTNEQPSGVRVNPPEAPTQQAQQNTVSAADLSDEDLLTTVIYKVPDEQKEVIRTRLLNRVLKSIVDMHTCYLQEVALFVTIREHEQAYVTPYEQLVMQLVNNYGWGKATPEDVADCVEEFPTEFKDAISTAQYLYSRYPGLVGPS
jgi:hypothetical protein